MRPRTATHRCRGRDLVACGASTAAETIGSATARTPSDRCQHERGALNQTANGLCPLRAVGRQRTQGEFAMYFYDTQQQGPQQNWQQMGQIGPQFAQLLGSWLGNGNPGLAAYGQQGYGQQYGQYGTPPAFGAFGHNSGWGAQPQWNMQPAGGPLWGQQHRQLSPYDVNEVVRQLVPALPQIIAQAQQPYPGLAYAAYGQAPRTLTPQDVNDVVRQLLPLLPQVVGALQGQPSQQFAMHGGIGGMGQGHLGQNFGAQNPFAVQNPLAASFQQPWPGQLGAP